MNGRIYDALLGRFLSADIVVQNPGDLQAFNRYSYVWNNPLTRTDPSGWWNIWNPLTYGLPNQAGQNPWSITDSSAEWKATAEGASGGAQIYANSLTMGATDAMGVTNAGALANDSDYNGSRIAGGVGTTALMIATGGTAAEGSAGAQVLFAAMAGKAATDGADQAGTGAAQIANDPKSAQGYVNVALGTVNMVGSVAGASAIGNATAGVNNAAPKTGSAPEVNPTTAPAAEGAACFTAGTEIKIAEGFVAIETVRVGERVLTDSDATETKVDPQTWRLVTLRLKGVGEDVFEIECLRPLGWLQENSLKPGSRVHFAVSEMGIDGDAEVIDVAACPAIATGSGRVVLMTVTHFNPTVLELTLAGLGKPLEPTATHRLFSADRNDWVQAQELRVGEHLKTADGAVEINAIARKPGVHRVYNIEVETEHRYLVSKLQVVSHNACAQGPGKPFTQAQKSSILEANRQKNDGVLRSDQSGQPLVPAQKSQKGVTPPANEAQVDHIKPRSKGGANTTDNAQVLSRKENRAKSNKVPPEQE